MDKKEPMEVDQKPQEQDKGRNDSPESRSTTRENTEPAQDTRTSVPEEVKSEDSGPAPGESQVQPDTSTAPVQAKETAPALSSSPSESSAEPVEDAPKPKFGRAARRRKPYVKPEPAKAAEDNQASDKETQSTPPKMDVTQDQAPATAAEDNQDPAPEKVESETPAESQVPEETEHSVPAKSQTPKPMKFQYPEPTPGDGTEAKEEQSVDTQPQEQDKDPAPGPTASESQSEIPDTRVSKPEETVDADSSNDQVDSPTPVEDQEQLPSAPSAKTDLKQESAPEKDAGRPSRRSGNRGRGRGRGRNNVKGSKTAERSTRPVPVDNGAVEPKPLNEEAAASAGAKDSGSSRTRERSDSRSSRVEASTSRTSDRGGSRTSRSNSSSSSSSSGTRRTGRRPHSDRTLPPRDPNLNTDIFINKTPHETRIGIKENEVLVELLVESPENERLVGAIFKGKVTTVLPGMQAAFVDIGLEKAAFLHVTDIGVGQGDAGEEYEENEDGDDTLVTKKADRAPIQEILKRGQELVIQVVKEQIGTKGPRVTTQLSLAGRYVVLMPTESVIRVSKRIASWAEKKRLRRVAQAVKPEGYGLIIRTVAENADEAEFKQDIQKLVDKWEKVKSENASNPSPCMIYSEGGITSGVVRDLLSDDVRRVIVDDKEEYQAIMGYMKQLAPEMRKTVELYSESQPIFDKYGIEREIDRMFERKIWFKGGAYLVIDQTEAMVTIDVNTGRFVGKSDQSTTVLLTNLEASKEVARQVRLRDIGGLIVVDLIDMYNRDHKKQVYDQFTKAFRNDRAKRSISQISEFGLIEMTRERVRPSLMHALSDPCPTCEGIGRILSTEVMSHKIDRWFQRARVAAKFKKFILTVTPEVAEYLVDRESDRVHAWCRKYRFHIEVIRDTLMHPEKFEVVNLGDSVDITERYKPGSIDKN